MPSGLDFGHIPIREAPMKAWFLLVPLMIGVATG
jgi:hypothetical protein